MPNDKIPDDIMAAARECAGRIHGLNMDVWETEKAVARAIAAERERCAGIADERKHVCDRIASGRVDNEHVRNSLITRASEADAIAAQIRRGA